MQRGLDDHDTIKCINYIRATVAAGGDPLPVLLQGGTPYNDDQYFRPVLEDDALLFQDFSEAANAECAPFISVFVFLLCSRYSCCVLGERTILNHQILIH